MGADARPDAVAVDASGVQAATLECGAIRSVEDWQRLEIAGPGAWEDRRAVFDRVSARTPLVIAVTGGTPTLKQLRLAGSEKRCGRPVLLWWPAEGAVDLLEGSDRLREVVQRLALRLHHEVAPVGALLALFVRRGLGELRRSRLRPRALAGLAKRFAKKILGSGALAADLDAVRRLVLERSLGTVRVLLAETLAGAKAADLPPPGADGIRFPARGVYIRLDWWNAITSGGSYGHTCYVAAELTKRSEGFGCLMAHPFPLLDELGVPQRRLEAPYASWGEADLAGASEACLPALRDAIRRARPGFVYERLVVGNFAVARICQELSIPYIVEFNGSESSMMRSFGGRAYMLEHLYLKAEQAAFAQAALITVVSHPIRKSLIERGVPSSKIVVIPNGVDAERYAPMRSEARVAIRRELGFGDEDFVIGFTGTFGGWHGIDDLAEILPRVCAREPRARFLLIGDGTYRHLVDEAVARDGLDGRVRFTGRVPQQEGARLLGVCDAFLSPHNSHMVDSRFFGSPTKVFEYMAVGSAIVASDLEQIGEVLRPALRSAEVSSSAEQCADRRAVLCRPGDVEGFVTALVGLARNPDLARALGANARRAALEEFTWGRHVERLARAFGGAGGNASWEPAPCPGEPRPRSDRELGSAAAKDGVRPRGVAGDKPASGATVAAAATLLAGATAEARPLVRRTDAVFAEQLLRGEARGGQRVLEIAGGPWSDLDHLVAPGCRLARVDFTEEWRALARGSFAPTGPEVASVICVRGAHRLPFEDDSFDLVYAVTGFPDSFATSRIVDEMWRVVRPGGRVMLCVNAQRSAHYWVELFWRAGVRRGLLDQVSMAEIAAREAARRAGGVTSRPRIHKRSRLRRLFDRFEKVEIRSGRAAEEDRVVLRGKVRVPFARMLRWNLVVTARKPCAG